MAAYRSIRIQMPDRPGALSAVSTALAVHGVNIVRLDVVSSDESMVVDDLLLQAKSQEDIGAALGSFQPDVTVRTFDEHIGDPVIEMGVGLAAVAAAADLPEARQAAADGARKIARGDVAAMTRALPTGGHEILAGPAGLPMIYPNEPFTGRWVNQRAQPVAFPSAPSWAPEAFQKRLNASWVALAPSGPFDVLIVARKLSIPFLPGELERLAVFADGTSSILGGRGDRPHYVSLPVGTEEPPPPRHVRVSGQVEVA